MTAEIAEPVLYGRLVIVGAWGRARLFGPGPGLAPGPALPLACDGADPCIQALGERRGRPRGPTAARQPATGWGPCTPSWPVAGVTAAPWKLAGGSPAAPWSSLAPAATAAAPAAVVDGGPHLAAHRYSAAGKDGQSDIEFPLDKKSILIGRRASLPARHCGADAAAYRAHAVTLPPPPAPPDTCPGAGTTAATSAS